MSYIEVNNVSKTIGGVEVLNNITLSFEKGKIYGLIGRNGSGKTMLLRAICGFINLNEGTIIVDKKKIGVDISFPENLGVIIETPGFIGGYTGYQNLEYLASIRNNIKKEDILEIIKKVGLEGKENIKVKKYSLGMNQRLGLAQAIMENPEIIVLDEPTIALDKEGVKMFKEIMKEEKSKGKTIIIATHDHREIEEIADEIHEMDNGKLYGGEII